MADPLEKMLLNDVFVTTAEIFKDYLTIVFHVYCNHVKSM